MHHGANHTNRSTDPRHLRIADMQNDYNQRVIAAKTVAKDGNWETFMDRTVEMKGHLAGLRESLTLVPPAPDPEPESAAAVLPVSTPADEQQEAAN